MEKTIEELGASMEGALKGGVRGVPISRRKEVVAFVVKMREEGMPWKTLSEGLGIAEHTLYKWKKLYASPAKAKPKAFVPIHFSPEIASISPIVLSLVTPLGYRIEGLDLQSVLKLLSDLK